MTAEPIVSMAPKQWWGEVRAIQGTPKERQITQLGDLQWANPEFSAQELEAARTYLLDMFEPWVLLESFWYGLRNDPDGTFPVFMRAPTSTYIPTDEIDVSIDGDLLGPVHLFFNQPAKVGHNAIVIMGVELVPARDFEQARAWLEIAFLRELQKVLIQRLESLYRDEYLFTQGREVFAKWLAHIAGERGLKRGEVDMIKYLTEGKGVERGIYLHSRIAPFFGHHLFQDAYGAALAFDDFNLDGETPEDQRRRESWWERAVMRVALEYQVLDASARRAELVDLIGRFTKEPEKLLRQESEKSA